MVREALRTALAGLSVLLGMAGCGGGPTVIQESADGIALRWYHWDGDIVQAASAAGEHCQLWDKYAVLEQESVDQDVTLAHFACR